MTQTIEGAIVDWLEEIPVEELSSQTAQEIVESFRADLMDVTEAIDRLQEACSEDLEEYVKGNRALALLFGEES